MTLFMILISVSKEAYSQGLGLKQILLLIPYLLPEALRFAVPGTVLFAASAVYGRMAAANEIVAIKASGISPLTVLWPTFIFAFLLSIGTVWLNDVACSWGRDGTRRVVIESVEEIAYSRLETQRSYSSKQFSINVKRVDGRKLISPIFTFGESEDSAPVTITCEDAELKSDLAAATLAIVCHNGTIDIGDAHAVFPDTMERIIPLDEASKRGVKGASDLPLYQVPHEMQAQQEAIDTCRDRMALGIRRANDHGRFPEPDREANGRMKNAICPTCGCGTIACSWSQPAAGRTDSVVSASCCLARPSASCERTRIS